MTRCEGPIEVTLSRVLSAVVPPAPGVFSSRRSRSGTRKVHTSNPGAAFDWMTLLISKGNWSWQENPFVGTRPYQGLLAILLMFNSSDIKNDEQCSL